MDIKIVDYNKSFENAIDVMLNNQWNVSFVHERKIIGKIALVDSEFAGVCYGWKQK